MARVCVRALMRMRMMRARACVRVSVRACAPSAVDPAPSPWVGRPSDDEAAVFAVLHQLFGAAAACVRMPKVLARELVVAWCAHTIIADAKGARQRRQKTHVGFHALLQIHRVRVRVYV